MQKTTVFGVLGNAFKAIPEENYEDALANNKQIIEELVQKASTLPISDIESFIDNNLALCIFLSIKRIDQAFVFLHECIDRRVELKIDAFYDVITKVRENIGPDGARIKFPIKEKTYFCKRILQDVLIPLHCKDKENTVIRTYIKQFIEMSNVSQETVDAMIQITLKEKKMHKLAA